MTLLDEIINWVEKQPTFWQTAIERLIRNNTLTDEDIIELKNICKADCGLLKFSYDKVNFNDLRDIASKSASNNSVNISKIFNINNINALSKESTLEFPIKGLVVIYGDNGSGKSSYVVIFKHACNTRGKKPKINNNLYDPSSIEKDKKADIEYTLDGINFKIVKLVNGEVDNSILKNIDVFDSFSANHYIEGEDEIAFIPQGLSILEKLAIGVKKVENELNNELLSSASGKFDYSILDISDGSTAYTFLKNLNSETKLDELRTESSWNSSKKTRIEELTNQIEKLKKSDPKKTLKENEEKINRFKILQDKFQTLEDNLTEELALEKIKSLINHFILNRKALKESSEKAFSDLPIKGVGNDHWKLLWESARKFYNESTKTNTFPQVDSNSNCPLCFQYLGDDAKNRFTSFEKFVKEDIQKSYNESSNKIDLEVEKLNMLDFSFKDQEPITLELNELVGNYSKHQSQYLEELLKQKDYLINLFSSEKSIETINTIEIEDTPKIAIQTLIKTLKERNKKLEIQSIEEDLKPLNKEFNQLNGERKLYDVKPQLGREIYRQKRVKLLNDCISKCNTRAITKHSNELTEKFITKNLKQNFKIELQKLGFKNIKIETETKGKKGRQYHFLRLDEQNENKALLKDVLSEGEHRCISLATFMSELSISEHKSAIIFDDPVSSLDHKWRNKISERITEEALKRQVIVFTHDITFLLMLQEHCEKLHCDLNLKSLTRKTKETGLLANNPPWDTLSVKKRLAILKENHQELAQIESTETDEIYKEQAKLFYGKLRETWERFVEEVFLNGVIQRFGRSIQTKRLSKITDLTDSDYEIVDTNMSKCSTYFTGHDTSGALIEETPNSDECFEDIKVLEDYIKSIRRRRQ